MKYTLGYRERNDGGTRRAIIGGGSPKGYVWCTPRGWHGELNAYVRTMNGAHVVLTVEKNSPGIVFSPVQAKRVMEDTLALAIVELYDSIKVRGRE